MLSTAWATTCCASPGIGEFATVWPLFGKVTPPANYEAALQLVAKQGWPFQQHSLSLAEDQLTASTFEKVNAVTPIADLRWSIAHVPHIDQETVNRFKALGAGIAVHPFEYLAGAPGAGPPMRMIVDSGIHVGAGSDAAQISTLDPWLMIYYMVTGKNAAGTLINAGQTLTRMEALRLYTANNGWFFREEDRLGSIEPGKLGDVVVLSDDFLDPAKVPDEANQAREVRTHRGRRQSSLRQTQLITFTRPGCVKFVTFRGRLPTRIPSQNMAHSPASMTVTARFGKIGT